MQIDKNSTPEQQWDEIKNKIFKNKCPESLDKIIKKGFREATSEHEKWVKLSALMIMIKKP